MKTRIMMLIFMTTRRMVMLMLMLMLLLMMMMMMVMVMVMMGDYGDYGDCGDCAGDEPTFHWTDKSIVLASDHPRLSIVPFWSPPAHHKIPELQLSITCGNW